jgi:hypothetical protein
MAVVSRGIAVLPLIRVGKRRRARPRPRIHRERLSILRRAGHGRSGRVARRRWDRQGAGVLGGDGLGGERGGVERDSGLRAVQVGIGPLRAPQPRLRHRRERRRVQRPHAPLPHRAAIHIQGHRPRPILAHSHPMPAAARERRLRRYRRHLTRRRAVAVRGAARVADRERQMPRPIRRRQHHVAGLARPEIKDPLPRAPAAPIHPALERKRVRIGERIA